MKLPSTTQVMTTLDAKQDAVDTVERLIKRNMELEDIYDLLQPLLYELSVKLYADNNETISLYKLIEDSVKFLKGE